MIEHIEKLLLKHDCVIIPGLGGLVVNYRSACFVPEKNLFMPPARRTGFNVHLTYNDGLLAQSFMQEQACPYEAAMKQIDEQVQVILSKLKTGRPLQLGKIGVLSIDKSNRIVFEPGVGSFLIRPRLVFEPKAVQDFECLPIF